MSSLIETYDYKGHVIEIHYDESGSMECPLENYTADEVQFVTFERNSTLSNYHEFNSPKDIKFPGTGARNSLYKYEHSGVAYSTVPFSCPWDSGQVGEIWTADGYDPFSICLDVAAWCNGEIYGYFLLDPRGETIDSCWGFLGDIDHCKAEAEAYIDGIQTMANRT